MKPPVQTPSSSERLGQRLGRLWRGCLRHERKLNNWLVAQGLPAGVAKAVLLLIKLLALGVLLYVAFWLALLLVFALVAASAVRNSDWETPDPEWMNGTAGFGLYTHDGHRIDPHVSDGD
ncbi:hypothetical protein CQW32_04930 [Pseudomonas putida]|uniref:DUF3742 family protein n=1 Tax=Pseudomonas TaxID=286 RepID=UPI000C2A2799|nr:MULTISPECIES: DUF3742 family protein [Pseudomonas]PJX11566.1 hypothetical protein CQW32_04930 [Pseudomonas putida]